METSYYLDDRTLAMEQTLIRLKCEGGSVTVPVSFGGHQVSVVGSGALTLSGVQELAFAPGYVELKEKCLGFSQTLQSIHVPESVRVIAETLFVRTFYASNLQLYIDRALQPASFLDIRQAALPVGGMKRLLPPALLNRAEMEPVRCLMRQSASPPALICKEMRILFRGQIDDTKSGIYTGTIFEPRPCYDFLFGREETEEYTAVMEMIRADDPGWHDTAAERKSDLIIRRGNNPVAPGTCSQVALAMCGQLPDAPGPDSLFHIQIHMYRQHLFFPALRYVRHRGSDWWIYSRNYLTMHPDQPYLREDVGVFDRDGLVTDRKTSEDVYAKFRFLAIL